MRRAAARAVALTAAAVLLAAPVAAASAADGTPPSAGPAGAAASPDAAVPAPATDPAAPPPPGGAPSPTDPVPASPPAPAAFAVAAPSRAHGATTARVTSPTFARRRLASPSRGWRIGTQTTWSRQQLVLLVLGGAVRDGREWVKVLLPVRPNGSAGWIPRDRVVLARTPWWIDVRTGSRRVTVFRAGRRVRAFRAVVGARRTPTPRGLAAIYERNRQPDPHAFLGPWALALTSLSNVLEDYGGGPGRIAIHGRSGASLEDRLGTARSHGCVRINDAHVAWIARHVPRGTPVRVRR